MMKLLTYLEVAEAQDYLPLSGQYFTLCSVTAQLMRAGH